LLQLSILKNKKSFIPKKNVFLSRCQYQNKKALFTEPIFSEGFGIREVKVFFANKKGQKVQLCAFTMEFA
jgi:hypothetical protein